MHYYAVKPLIIYVNKEASKHTTLDTCFKGTDKMRLFASSVQTGKGNG